MKRSIKKQRGFTLIELGIVLALSGIVLFYAVSKMTSTGDQVRAQALVGELAQIVQNTKRLYATQGSYNGVTIAALRNNTVFPSSWNGTAAGTITGPFTGAVTVGATTLTTADDAVMITTPNVPTSVCSEAARMLADGVNIITVGGTVVKANNGALNIDTLGTQCSAANSVSFAVTFGKV